MGTNTAWGYAIEMQVPVVPVFGCGAARSDRRDRFGSIRLLARKLWIRTAEEQEQVKDEEADGDEQLLYAKRYRQASEWPCVRFN